MKILIIHNKYQIPGGEDIVFDRESNLLEASGHQVYQYIKENNEIAKSISKLEAGIRVVWSKKDFLEVSRIIQDCRPDIIHVHNFFPLISPSIYYAASKYNIPIIQTLHNYRLWCLNGYFIRENKPCELCLGKPVPLPGIFYKCYHKSMLQSAAVALMQVSHKLLGTWEKKASRYIVMTEFFRKKAIEGGLPSAKLIVKPNFLNHDPGQEFNKSDFLLYVGRLSPEKGIHVLLQTWLNHPNLPPLKLIGQGLLADDVLQAASQHSNIEYIGSLPPYQVYDWMGKAKALIFPSQWYEGLPLTIIESFAKGTPVIASKLGAMKSLIKHEYNGLHFEPGNTEDMISKVHWMTRNPDRWVNMQQNARRDFEENFTAEKNYQMLIEIYQQAISQVKSGRAV